MKLTERQLEIIQHSLGCDIYGHTTYRGSDGPYYRNRFITGSDGPDYQHIRPMVEAGLIMDHGKLSYTDGCNGFSVTPAGIAAMKEQSPEKPGLTRAQERYKRYLLCDTGVSFGEWIRAGGAK